MARRSTAQVLSGQEKQNTTQVSSGQENQVVADDPPATTFGAGFKDRGAKPRRLFGCTQETNAKGKMKCEDKNQELLRAVAMIMMSTAICTSGDRMYVARDIPTHGVVPQVLTYGNDRGQHMRRRETPPQAGDIDGRKCRATNKAAVDADGVRKSWKLF